MEEQEAVTMEISRNVQRAADGTSGVAEMSRGSNEAAIKTDRSAAQVLSALGLVKEASDHLQHRIDQFIQEVAA
jgi:methyl-accepting chemotaxis protein